MLSIATSNSAANRYDSVAYAYRFVFRPHGCPCGYYTDPRRECHCTPAQIQRYRSRISGPLLDRIDIHLDVPAVEYRDLARRDGGETSRAMLDHVLRSREVQARRFADSRLRVNSQMTTRHVKKHCILTADAEQMLAQAMQALALSARAYTKILKVSRTIADLEGSNEIRTEHVAEAIQYRSLDRSVWA